MPRLNRLGCNLLLSHYLAVAHPHRKMIGRSVGFHRGKVEKERALSPCHSCQHCWTSVIPRLTPGAFLGPWYHCGPFGTEMHPGIIDPQCDAVETCRAAGEDRALSFLRFSLFGTRFVFAKFPSTALDLFLVTMILQIHAAGYLATGWTCMSCASPGFGNVNTGSNPY